MSQHQLAQLNIAAMREPLDSPGMAEFVANLDRVNALAEAAPGFVWRLQSDDGDATEYRPLGDMTLVNLSVWKDLDALKEFIYKSGHAEIMRRRTQWFDRMREAYAVLWWVPQGHRPTIEEAIARLEHLRAHGPTEAAFNFGKAFAAPGSTLL
jgi:hypothetical protein